MSVLYCSLEQRQVDHPHTRPKKWLSFSYFDVGCIYGCYPWNRSRTSATAHVYGACVLCFVFSLHSHPIPILSHLPSHSLLFIRSCFPYFLPFISLRFICIGLSVSLSLSLSLSLSPLLFIFESNPPDLLLISSLHSNLSFLSSSSSSPPLLHPQLNGRSPHSH